MTLSLEETGDFILCKEKTRGWADPRQAGLHYSLFFDMFSLEAPKYGSSSIKQCWMEF